MGPAPQKTPEEERAGKEENHWRYRRIEFGRFRVFEQTDPPVASSHRVGVLQRDHRTAFKPLDTLSADECRYFCCKDVTIYVNPPGSDRIILNPHSLFDTIYERFLPHRDMRLDLEGGHFFTQLVDFKPTIGRGTLSEISAFHEALCHKMEREIPHLKQADRHLPDGFGLLPTFKSVFAVLEDYEAAEPSVLVVCRDDETAKWLKFTDEEREQDPNAGCAGKVDEEAWKAWPFRYRMGLIRFMDAVFATDERRKEGRK